MSSSFRQRYFVKLASNGASAFVQLLLQAIVPRGLGVADYGTYSFLTHFFTQLTGFFEMGTSLGFFTRLSQRPEDKGLVNFYLAFTVAIAALQAAFVSIASWTPLREVLWPGQGLQYVWLATGWGALTWLSQVLARMADAWGITVSAELIKITQRGATLAAAVLLFFTGRLGLESFLVASNLLLAGYCVALFVLFTRTGHWKPADARRGAAQWLAHAKDLYAYSLPLFLYSLASLFTALFDRWLLQIFGGNIEQGLFGLSFQLATAMTLFISAMTPLVHRELSVSWVRQDVAAMERLFMRTAQPLFAIVTLGSAFLIFQSDTIARAFGGAAYGGSGWSLAIMAFYPVYQTYGQLTSAVFYATDRTRLVRNIGIISSVAGTALTYFLIAPPGRFGLALGGIGLATKMVVVQFVTVMAQLYLVTLLLRTSLGKMALQQAATMGIFGLTAYASTKLGSNFLDGDLQRLFGSGLVYSLASGAILLLCPWLYGLEREDMVRILRRLVRLRKPQASTSCERP